jgi:hypothetical protein
VTAYKLCPPGSFLANSKSRLNSNPIVNRRSNSLLATQVTFRRLNGNVPEKKLDLFQLSSRSMAQARATATQIVRR